MLTEESTPRTNGLDAIPAASPAPPAAAPGYTLLAAEQMGFAGMNQEILFAKLAVYNLNAALEKALKEVDRLEAQFGGALAFLANSHGMAQCQITSDFARIAPPKEQQS